jgi:hypothetical protein
MEDHLIPMNAFATIVNPSRDPIME